MTKNIIREIITKNINKKGLPNDITTLSELILTVDANNNIGADASAFQNQVTGNNNIAIGDGTAASVITNNNSTFIGTGADALDGLDNVTVLGASASAATANTVVLGKSASTVIGTDSAITGLTLGTGTANAVTPAIYMSNNTNALPVPTGLDGIFSVKGGKPTFTDATGDKTLAAVGNDAAGSGTLNGTAGVLVNSSVVTPTSIVMVTRNMGTGGAPAIVNTGSLTVGSIVDGVSFTVYSTVAGDAANFNWMIVNP